MYVAAFMEDDKCMDWKKRLNKGRTNGQYTNYKDASALSIMYHQAKKGSLKPSVNRARDIVECSSQLILNQGMLT